jgi:ABC-2 type transport system permease protein
VSGVGGLLGQVRWIARRSVRRSLRQPAVIVPTIVFPLSLLAVNAGGLDDAARLPGFPGDAYLDFALGVAFMQAALFAAITAGTELAHDVEKGFLNRLALTPVRRFALLLGQLSGAVTIALLGAVTYVAVGLLVGVSFVAGAGGVVVLLLLALTVALAFAALGAALGLLTGSGEAVQGAFPLVFVLFFLSSANLPRNLIEADWFRAIATANPFSYLVEGIRSPIVVGWDGEALALGFGVAAAMLALALLAAGRLMTTRLERT